jgi:hypothetical protein
MNSFRRLKNPFIKDDSIIERTETIRTKQSIGPFSEIYGKKGYFEIPQDYDYLSQMSIKITATTTGDNTNIRSSPATKFFKYISLRTGNGEIIQNIYPEYSHYRIEQLRGTPLFERLRDSINYQPTFNNTTSICYLPLFMWFSEDTKLALRTRHLEKLVVYYEIADSKEDMGLVADLTAVDLELRLRYIEPRLETIPEWGEKIVYGVFQEPPVIIPANSTSMKVLLSCPYPIYSISFELFDSDRDEYEINRMVLESQSIKFFDIDTRGYFKLGNQEMQGDAPGAPFTKWFNRRMSRKDLQNETDFLMVTGAMYPCYLTVYFDSDTEDRTLAITMEHVNIFNFKSNGIIESSPTGEFTFNKNSLPE